MMFARTGVLAVMAALMLSAPVHAQRDPDYAKARADGKVGEKVDGYLGVVGAATPELQRIVDDINIKRRALYTRKAQENNATIEEYARAVGCDLISRTAAGEKYQAPDRSWKTRTGAPPERVPECP